MEQTSRRVLLVGHCGPDSSYLRISVSSALPGGQVSFANDDSEFQAALRNPPDLILINRVLDGMFSMESGVELIRFLRKSYPQIKTMLVSNYPEAQEEAIAAGALPGFGKRQLGSKEMIKMLREAAGVGEATRA
ncbi:MAG TPA: response regulator [Tepidisphaeraceae bacterium]